jgi:predicted MFS family arabinose efflux permease
MMLSLYPLIMVLGTDPIFYLTASLIGGFAWALAGGILYNFILERCPENDRPSYLVFYQVALNLGIFIGSLGGPLIARGIGLVPALIVFAVLRFLSGFLLQRYG